MNTELRSSASCPEDAQRANSFDLSQFARTIITALLV